MTPLAIAIQALEEIRDCEVREAGWYLQQTANEALADIRHAQYLEAHPVSAPDVMKEHLK